MALLTLPIGPALRAQEFWLPGPLDSLIASARDDSNDVILHHLVALGHLNREKLEPAERSFREAVGVDPRYAPAWLGLSAVTLAKHPDLFLPRWIRPRRRTTTNPDSVFRAASVLWRTAFLLDPLVDLRAPGAPTDSGPRVFMGGDLFARWEAARATARRGQYGSAIRMLSDLIDRSLRAELRDSADPLAFLMTNDFRYAEAFLRSRIGEVWRAEQAYRHVLTFDLGFWMVHVRLAELYDRVGRTEEALAERREALFLNPDDPMLEMDLGLALARAGQLAAGDTALARAMARLPRHAIISYHRGQIAWLLGPRHARRSSTSWPLPRAGSRARSPTPARPWPASPDRRSRSLPEPAGPGIPCREADHSLTGNP